MLYREKLNTSGIDHAFNDLEAYLEEFEEHARKFFHNPNLKIAFKVYDGSTTVSLEEYLLNHENDYGEIRVYFVKDKYYNGLKTKFSYEDYPSSIFTGGFSLDQMSGCCGIGIFFKSFVNIDYQNNKFGHYLVKLSKILAKEKDFTQLLCTDVATNTPQKIILDKFGFKKLLTFNNIKTKNDVEIRSCDLTDEQYYDVIWQKNNLISEKYGILKKLLKKISSIVTTK